MLHDGYDSRCDEAGGTNRPTRAGDLDDLNRSSGIRDFDAPAGPSRLNLEALYATPYVDEDLDSIASHPPHATAVTSIGSQTVQSSAEAGCF